jgi:hypothetical protein
MLNRFRYGLIFLVLSLVIIVFLATLNLLVVFPSQEEPVSEIWLLDSNHQTDDFPSAVIVGEEYDFYLGVGNRMNSEKSYRVYVKLGNYPQELPGLVNSDPSPLPPLYEYAFTIEDGRIREIPFKFKVVDAYLTDDGLIISDISIDGNIIPLDKIIKFDSIDNSFSFQLFFELWIAGENEISLQYLQNYVGISTKILTE